jgi:hypothetical protein
LLPTVTVIVAAPATPGWKSIMEMIATANTANQREQVFIASMIWHLAVVACNIAKVTELLLFPDSCRELVATALRRRSGDNALNASTQRGGYNNAKQAA